MKLLNALIRRVALPGDSETRRFQKSLLVLVSLVGAAGTLVNAVPLFGGGLRAMGWSYLASAFTLTAGPLAILIRPGWYVPVTVILLLDVLICPAVSQYFSGGFASGMQAIPWTVFSPLGAVLALGSFHAWIQLGLFAITILAVAQLEPVAVAMAPEISPATRVSFNVSSLLSLGLFIALASLYLLREVERYREQAESLLLNILPRSISSRLKIHPQTNADGYESVTVLFADIVDFTRLCADADPEEVVDLLNSLFSDFDDLAVSHGLEKIKTIGDAYMVAAGLPEERTDHTEAVMAFAIDMLRATSRHGGFRGQPIRIRVGINVGPVVAGVIGRRKFIYDLWGDAMNLASRMETSGLTNRIQVTRAVRDRLAGLYRFERRDPIVIKGKGLLETWLLVHEETSDPAPG